MERETFRCVSTCSPALHTQLRDRQGHTDSLLWDYLRSRWLGRQKCLWHVLCVYSTILPNLGFRWVQQMCCSSLQCINIKVEQYQDFQTGGFLIHPMSGCGYPHPPSSAAFWNCWIGVFLREVRMQLEPEWVLGGCSCHLKPCRTRTALNLSENEEPGIERQQVTGVVLPVQGGNCM